MQLSKTYDPSKVESKWYDHWMSQDFFSSKPDDRPPYSVVIPPPNVTGVLHMGHMLNNTLQDILVRKARMEGKNACWVPGTDHASVATEAKVVKMLAEKGIKKSDLTREEFLEHAWEWKEKYGGIILQQLKRLGASCDWNRTRFTMEEKLSDAVIKVFVDLYKKGYLYRDLKMINWDPAAKTTLSNEEVIYKDVTSKLYHIRYDFTDGSDSITIATTRPETILGDCAICVHPKDERYKDKVGKTVNVPLINRAIPIIVDDYVDMEFGTGALKITPAHDTNDYEIGKRHQLPSIDIFNQDGTMSEAAELYIGKDRFDVRDLISKELEEKGHLLDVEDIDNKVGYSERTDAVVEPRLSLQWFVDMQKLVTPALENVMNDTIAFHPERFKNTYRNWLENIRDWPISRQLWWGQRIPAYYYGEELFVAETAEEALQQAIEKTGNNDLTIDDLKQEEDVVDTWFSSWLWPISVFDGFENPDNEDIQYYYPTSVLVTGWDIIFFWVARMIMAGYEYKQELPFKDVYFTGMVRDQQRRKMSKQLGNSPDILALIDKYGADSVRTGILFCAPAGNDILYDEKLCEQGRNFTNKIWNALRLVKGWETEEQTVENNTAYTWFSNYISQSREQIEASFKSYRISEALMTLYKLIRDDFCGWYLEMIKPAYGKPIALSTYNETISLFEELMQMLHPFMPFITEEIWHSLKERKEEDCIMVSVLGQSADYDSKIIEQGTVTTEIVGRIREVRNKFGLATKDRVKVYYQSDDQWSKVFDAFGEIIMKCAGADQLAPSNGESKGDLNQVVVRDITLYVDAGKEVDQEEERRKLESEVEYTRGFIASVEKKLGNERFVQNAPEPVIAKERKKLADGEAKLKSLLESLDRLN